ncbi:MAG: hypothetical protein ACFFD4_29415 [Candidatus Odinarchaeota archaeon]
MKSDQLTFISGMSGMVPRAFEGINLTVLADDGPRALCTVIDSTSLNETIINEVVITKLGISGMTAIGMGSHTATFKLHGSLPVPETNQYQALAYPFRVSGDLSKDDRVRESGREVIIFLLFNLVQRDLIFRYYGDIEKKIKELTSSFKTEADLTEGAITIILQEINKIINIRNMKEVSRTKQRKETRIRESKTAPVPRGVPPELVNLLGRIKTLEFELEAILDQAGIVEDNNPIYAGVSYSGDTSIVNSESFTSTLNDYLKLLDILKAKDNSLLLMKKEINCTTLLVRAGHILFWHALKNPTSKIPVTSLARIATAVKCYAMLSEITQDAIIFLTLGSALNKLGRTDDATENIKKGFRLYSSQDNHNSIALNKKMIFQKTLHSG